MSPFHIHRRFSREKDLDITHGRSNLPQLVTDSVEPIDSGKYENLQNVHLSNHHSRNFLTYFKSTFESPTFARITLVFHVVAVKSDFSYFQNMYVAHFIGGTVGGIIFTSGLMFVTEISPVHIRGALCSCFVLMDYCGDLLGCVIGSFSTVRTYSYVAMSLAMMQFVMYVWCPETPYYLLRQKRLAAAMDSLILLRGTGDTTEEMDSIMKEFDPRSSGILSSLLHLISQPGK